MAKPNRKQRRAIAANKRRAVAKPPAREPKRLKGKLEFLADVTIKAAAGDGQQRRFDILAFTGEPLVQWWSDAPIVPDLSTMTFKQRTPILYDHRDAEEEVLGQSDSVTVDGSNLRLAGPFYNSSPRAMRIAAKADEGHVWQASIGAMPGKMDFVATGEKAIVNGREYAGPIRIARGGELKEVSIVVLGADGNTSTVVASGGSEMEFNDWLLSMGFDDPAALTEIQKVNLQKMYDDEMGEDDEPTETASATTPAASGSPATPTNAAATAPAIQATTPAVADPVVAHRQAIAGEETRIAAVRQVCASFQSSVNFMPMVAIRDNANRPQQVELQAHAIAQGWTAERTELEGRRVTQLAAVRNERTPVPRVIARAGHEQDATIQALSAAMILRAGGTLDHASFRTPQAVAMNVPSWLRAGINDAQRNQIMEAAHGFSDMSLVDLCRECVRIEGGNVTHNREEMIRAATSGSALTNIFTTNINTVILQTYMQAGDTTEGWVRATDVADFKLNERPRMVKGPSLGKLARGAEADHASRSDLEEKYKIARYAKQYVVDEQDIIDDHFNALSDAPREFGQASARLRPDLVYAILLANPTLNATSLALFSASNATSNALTTNALAAAALRTAVKTMMLIQENGVNLNLNATHIIVPPTLKFLAKELIRATTIVLAGTTLAERGSMNTLADEGLQMVTDARLENGVTDPNAGTVQSGSTSTWFLASAMAQTIEVAYRRGTGRAPRVRPFILERGRWGIGWDVNMDIGAAPMDWRGLQKNTA